MTPGIPSAEGVVPQVLACQGWQYNLGAYFMEGQRRTTACTHEPLYRVFINPPKGDDDGTRLACQICADFTWGTFRREPLELAKRDPSHAA